MKFILALALSTAFAQNIKRSTPNTPKPPTASSAATPAAPAKPSRTFAVNCAFGYRGSQLQGIVSQWQQPSTAGIVVGDFNASVARARDAIMNGNMDTLSTPGSVVVVLKNSRIAHTENIEDRGVCVVLEGDVQQASFPLRTPGA